MTLMEEAELNIRTFTPEETRELARAIQAKYGLGEDYYLTLKGESMDFTWNDQSLIEANGPNGREDSWGICQIHLPSHPTVTKEQALNPYWCMHWTAQHFVDGNATMWSVYNDL